MDTTVAVVAVVVAASLMDVRPYHTDIAQGVGGGGGGGDWGGGEQLLSHLTPNNMTDY